MFVHKRKGKVAKHFAIFGKSLKSEYSLFLFSIKMFVIRAGVNKMLVRVANREDSAQIASSEAVWSVSALFVLLAFSASN